MASENVPFPEPKRVERHCVGHVTLRCPIPILSDFNALYDTARGKLDGLFGPDVTVHIEGIRFLGKAQQQAMEIECRVYKLKEVDPT